MSNGGFSGNFFSPHIHKFIGQTVTVFTTSGGLSGSGFTGVGLEANCNFIRLAAQKGSAPTNPLNNNYTECYNGRHYNNCCNRIGAIVDIPIDRIASFVHNAI